MSSGTLLGLPCSLVLRDKRGEFEVRDAIKPALDATGQFYLDFSRVHDAVSKRNAEVYGTARRPTY